MPMLNLRETVCFTDEEKIATLLSKTNFFSPEEVEIGISLLRENLVKGDSSGYYFLIGELETQFVGYTCYGPIPGTINGFDLYWIAVDPKFQHTGYGATLLNITEQRVLALGGQRLYAETSSIPLYAPTCAFYENHGFILEGRLPDYYAPLDDKMLYVKYLFK
ncbi:MAG: GNAT family N-acetyltransferase [Sphaerochaetaceae bacterium]|jgi:GNAT superfamily N-acetyltransferase|nr:GNAT family N-acetyltransferase [Sphaerochaetaceae bacterium]MDD4220172.1 GNAT family N-acetyltransferase [Sphaerochaetaceae bacterium]